MFEENEAVLAYGYQTPEGKSDQTALSSCENSARQSVAEMKHTYEKHNMKLQTQL
jgi:hypothetical protein